MRGTTNVRRTGRCMAGPGGRAWYFAVLIAVTYYVRRPWLGGAVRCQFKGYSRIGWWGDGGVPENTRVEITGKLLRTPLSVWVMASGGCLET